MAALDAALINVSLQSISVDIHASLGSVQWIMNGYLLALAFSLPMSSCLVDRFGVRYVYIYGFCGFIVSSAFCGITTSVNFLIAARVVQGACGGVLAPLGQLIAARVAGPNLARVASIIMVPILLAPLLGPVIAGIILSVAGWRFLFLVNIPIGLLLLVMAASFIPKEAKHKIRRKLDHVGLFLISGGLVSLLYGLENYREILGVTTTVSGVFLICFYAFWSANKGREAIVYFGLLNGRGFRASAGSMFLLSGLTFSGQFVIPLYLSYIGVAPTNAGWLISPIGIGMICSYPFMGILTERFGARKIALFGAWLSVLGTAGLCYCVQYQTAGCLFVFVLFLRGVGLGAIGLPASTSAYKAIDKIDLGSAATSLNIFQRVGGAMIPSFCSILFSFYGGVSFISLECACIFLLFLHLLVIIFARGLPEKSMH